MGRGRQKAKQTKVARELKYSSYEPNYRQLERELAGGSSAIDTKDERSSDDPRQDPWADPGD
ncbi:MAG: DUF3073 domain-containing protein [Actinobacteria bacterium]|jgi:hypothetical protein|nr:DUF3073 domain-containing protein [Actinomycetota bacterium]MBU4337649.1 DUF3073 domain-containing protein [Actinomycetota bacterium]MCG2798239.1 DUF3073 domain-containing protein [Cellulomonas sp.]MCG2800741.1 DUF3073 domain-containing protein [Cellulomonas sp.]